MLDFPGDKCSKGTGVEQIEVHTSIRGGGIGILFCHLTVLPAVLLTGRGQKVLSSEKRNFLPENLFDLA